MMKNNTPKTFTNCWFEYVTDESLLFEDILFSSSDEFGALTYPKPRFVKNNIVFV